MKLRTLLLSGLALAAVAMPAAAAPFKIAFLAASSQNGYNQATYAGIQKAAKDLGVDVTIFDGAFDSTKQYAQVEDIVANKGFDALIVAPNDTVGIAPALEEATAAGIKVASVLFPVGPKLGEMQPQVKGLTTTVASDPSIGATAQANAVVDYCADKNPCKVLVLIGQLIYPFDNLRNDSYKKVLAQHSNIQIVATGEGSYDPDKSMKATQDALQAHPDINVILSNADQQVVGALVALQDAGIDSSKLYVMGGGADQIAIDSIRAGKSSATLIGSPFSEGYYALKALNDTLRGKTAPTWIDSATLQKDVPVIIDKKWLDAHPDYKGEWQG
jgi:ribose transport system substrate-binding protein